MNNYLVKFIYQIICGEGQHTAQFDEQLRYISANNEKEAAEKGRHIGLQEEEIFYNERKQMVQWKFIDISDIYSLNELGDGAEVFSQIKETDDAATYRNFVHHKAIQIRKQFSYFTTETV